MILVVSNTSNTATAPSQPPYGVRVREASHACCGLPGRHEIKQVLCQVRTWHKAGRRPIGPARDARLSDRLRCPRRQMKQRLCRQADPGTTDQTRSDLVDLMCLCATCLRSRHEIAPRSPSGGRPPPPMQPNRHDFLGSARLVNIWKHSRSWPKLLRPQ
jgi:hypothetical protein